MVIYLLLTKKPWNYIIKERKKTMKTKNRSFCILLSAVLAVVLATVLSAYTFYDKRSYLILNTSMANSAIVNSLNTRRFSYLGKRKTILTEHKIDDYKTDIYIRDTNTVIEIKSIISTISPGIFPTVYSERTLQQLSKIQDLLSRGYKVCFIIVSLNPYLKEIQIDEQTEFFSKFSSCIEKGMVIKAYSCKFNEEQLLISNEIPIK